MQDFHSLATRGPIESIEIDHPQQASSQIIFTYPPQNLNHQLCIVQPEGSPSLKNISAPAAWKVIGEDKWTEVHQKMCGLKRSFFFLFISYPPYLKNGYIDSDATHASMSEYSGKEYGKHWHVSGVSYFRKWFRGPGNGRSWRQGFRVWVLW